MATNFLWYPGTGNNGLVVSALTLMSTELNSLGSAGTAESSVGGSSGQFTNSNTGQAMLGDIFLTLGTVSSDLSTGAAASGWFLTTYSGTNIEHVTTGGSGVTPARPPDFVVPLPATTITTGWIFKTQSPVMIPALPFYVYLQNNSGQAWASSANTLILAPYTMQY